MHGEEIGFGERVLDAEDFGKVVDDFVGLRERKATLFFEAAGRVDADRELLSSVFAACKVFDVLEVAKGPGEKLSWLAHMDVQSAL